MWSLRCLSSGCGLLGVFTVGVVCKGCGVEDAFVVWDSGCGLEGGVTEVGERPMGSDLISLGINGFSLLKKNLALLYF